LAENAPRHHEPRRLLPLACRPHNDTCYLYYCACGTKGRDIGLLSSKPITSAATPTSPTH
jgi:hypothetical protein